MNRSNYAQLLQTAGLCWLSAALAFASGSAAVPLNKLVTASTDIIIGKVVQGSISGATASLSITVERVLKGNLAAGANIVATASISEPSAQRPVGTARGIFFLSTNSSGNTAVVSPLSGYVRDERSSFLALPGVASAAPVLPSNASPKECVMLEVLSALEGGEQIPAGGFIDILWEYQSDPSPSVRSTFQRWAEGTSPRLVGISLRALVAEGDLSALNRIATDQSVQTNAAAPALLDSVKLFKNTDPEAIVLLGKLATTITTAAPLRTSAAMALAQIHNKQTLPFLAQLLTEQKTSLLTAAVGGLSSFANNVPIGRHEPAPGAWPFRTDDTIAHSAFDERTVGARQSYYVGFWQSWWLQNQSAVTQ